MTLLSGKWPVLLVVGGLGLSIFLAGALWGVSRFTHYLGSVRTVGTLVDNVTETSHYKDSRRESTTVSYYPIVEFQAKSGETIRFKGATGSTMPDQRIGKRFVVYYDPHNPSSAQIGQFAQMWLGPIVVTMIGLMLLGAAFVTKRMWESHEEEMKISFGESRIIGEQLLDQMIVSGTSRRITGTVREVRALDGNDAGMYLIVVNAVRPGSSSYEEFLSPPFTLAPATTILGQHVDIELDPDDPGNYAVQLDQLMPYLGNNNKSAL